MQRYPQHVVKRLACPACGEANRIRFGASQMLLEAPCSSCGVLIRWKRKTMASAHGVVPAFADYEPEVAVPDRGGAGALGQQGVGDPSVTRGLSERGAGP